MNSELKKINDLIDQSKLIVIAQADNPDGDSLASALALESILHNQGKEPILYCGVEMPKHLHHLSGSDRVSKELPKKFDCAIIVDCSSINLFEIAQKSGELNWILAKPTIILDHHDVNSTIDATINYNKTDAVSTGEVIYSIAKESDWQIPKDAADMIAVSILADSLGLMTQGTTSRSIRIIADLVDMGVNLPALDEARRATMRKSKELVNYKGELLQRIEYHNETDIATITIPWDEIERYSNQYNPSILVLDDMRLTEGNKVAIAFKTYPDGKITAKIRCNYGYPVAKDLAEHFGAGGHAYASGFKVTSRPFEEVKQECLEVTSQLLQKNGREL